MGMYTSKGPIPATKNNQTETDIRKTGKVLLTEVKTSSLPKDYLNLLPGSDGKDIRRGFSKKAK